MKRVFSSLLVLVGFLTPGVSFLIWGERTGAGALQVSIFYAIVCAAALALVFIKRR